MPIDDPLVPLWRKARRGGKKTLDGYFRRSEVEKALWNKRKRDMFNLKHGMYTKKHKGFEFWADVAELE